MKKFTFILLLPVLSLISLNTLSIMMEKKHYISAIHIKWAKKTDTTLISYECQSGRRSPMKLHSRQFQHVFTQRIKSQLNLTKNSETNAGCLIKRCVWKLNIALLEMLNNCSKCLICTSTVLRTSFNTHFLCGIAYPYLPSLCELYVSCVIIPLLLLLLFLGNYGNLVAINVILLKAVIGKPCSRANPVCQMWESLQLF